YFLLAVLVTALLDQVKSCKLLWIVPPLTPVSKLPPPASTSSTNWIVPSALLNNSLTSQVWMPAIAGREPRPNRQSPTRKALWARAIMLALLFCAARGVGRHVVSHSNCVSTVSNRIFRAAFPIVLCAGGCDRAAPELASNPGDRVTALKRVVSLSPLATRFVLAIGVEERIVGGDASSIHMPELAGRPAVDLAGAADLEPALVLGTEAP